MGQVRRKRREFAMDALRKPVSTRGGSQRRGDRRYGPVDVVVRVGERDERRLELRRREIHARFEQRRMETAETRGVRAERALKVSDGPRVEEEREHRADTLHDGR